MTSERNDLAPRPDRPARPAMPTWQIVLVLAIVAGVYLATRDRRPPELTPEHPRSEATSSPPPHSRGQLPGPDDSVGRRDLPDGEAANEPGTDRPSRRQSPARREDGAKYTIPDVVVRDRDNRIAWQGTVDLTPTIARIQAGERLRFANDGSVFQNRERKLPRERAGYYHEYVHPTPGFGGPGPQRVIMGAGGEVYYTADHYRTFTTIRGP